MFAGFRAPCTRSTPAHVEKRPLRRHKEVVYLLADAAAPRLFAGGNVLATLMMQRWNSTHDAMEALKRTLRRMVDCVVFETGFRLPFCRGGVSAGDVPAPVAWWKEFFDMVELQLQ